MYKFLVAFVLCTVALASWVNADEVVAVQPLPEVLVQPAPLPEGVEGFMEIKGDTVYLYYPPGANLRKIEARLRSRYLPLAAQYRDLFINKEYSLESRLSARLQFLLMRVEDILGMKPMIARINIEVLPSRKELQAKCFDLTQVHQDYKAFYAHDRRMIFSSEQDIIDSIIAHELGHAVIDHYFMVPPPTKVAELLATYVDEHLERE
ncbi:MAG: hypothetical protein WCI27_10430 [Candidatus Omnitrophota bacterium]